MQLDAFALTIPGRRGNNDLAAMATDLAAIARRALAVAPADRYASMIELCAALTEARRSREPAGPVELGHWVRCQRGR
jgi:hypothetical protein